MFPKMVFVYFGSDSDSDSELSPVSVPSLVSLKKVKQSREKFFVMQQNWITKVNQFLQRSPLETFKSSRLLEAFLDLRAQLLAIKKNVFKRKSPVVFDEVSLERQKWQQEYLQWGLMLQPEKILVEIASKDLMLPGFPALIQCACEETVARSNPQADFRKTAEKYFEQLCSRFSKRDHLTIVSLGSGDLLQELIFIAYLRAAGFKNVTLELVDIKYNNLNKEKAIKQFFQALSVGFGVAVFSAGDTIDNESSQENVLLHDLAESFQSLGVYQCGLQLGVRFWNSIATYRYAVQRGAVAAPQLTLAIELNSDTLTDQVVQCAPRDRNVAVLALYKWIERTQDSSSVHSRVYMDTRNCEDRQWRTEQERKLVRARHGI